ncbi:MAG: hypothetical protein OEM98_01550, partial [Gammaproteobacteria bacterium]|nr:hypothetical protein [Gammaproteobacteria bacterium]
MRNGLYRADTKTALVRLRPQLVLQGLQGLHGFFFTAQGLQGLQAAFFTAQGLQGLQAAFFTAQGL